MKFKKVRVINITASEGVLLERLSARGRDSEESIKERIARSKKLEPTGPFVIDVVNEGTKEEGIMGVVDALRAYEPQPPPRVVFLADSHAEPAAQLEIASAIASMDLPDGADLWLEMIVPEEVAAIRATFEDKSAEEFFLEMEQQEGEEAPAENAAETEEVRPAEEPKEDTTVEAEEGQADTAEAAEGEGAEAEAADEEEEPYGGLYCDEAALRQVLAAALGRLGWPVDLEGSLVAVLRTAHMKGSVLHALDEPEYTLAAFEERRLTQPPPPVEGEEEPPPPPSDEALRFKARMEYAHDRVNKAAHRFLERLEAYGGMGARPQLVLCGVEHWQTLSNGLMERGAGEPVTLEPVLAPSQASAADSADADADAADEQEASLDPAARATTAFEARRALLAPPRSATLFGDAESEDDMEVEPMLAAVMGVHHPAAFAPAKLEE
jgi:hypothetical protein